MDDDSDELPGSCHDCLLLALCGSYGYQIMILFETWEHIVSLILGIILIILKKLSTL